MIKNIKCKGKNKYRKFQQAVIIAQYEMKIGRSKQLYTYRCLFCSNWHLTHNPNKFDVKKFHIKKDV